MIDTDTRRVMPHDDNVEKAVLGAMLDDNKIIPEVVEILIADDFYSSGHTYVFDSIIRITDRGGAADILTVIDDLRNAGFLSKSGGESYIAGLTDRVISSANAKHHAQIVKGKAIDRRIIETANRMREAVYSGQTEEAIAEAQKSIFSLSMERGKNSIRTIRDVAVKQIALYETRSSQGGIKKTGISTGLERSLDDITGGLQDGELIIIAGRPSMGKTAFGIAITKAAVLSGIPALIISLEMSAESITDRILANMSGKDMRQLTRGFILHNEWPSIIDAASEIGNAPLFICDGPDITPAEIRAKARRLKSEHNLGLLVVDYIGLVKVPGKHDTREQAVAEISRTLKAIARELSIPVIGLSQLNRQVDGRPNKHPMLSDLRESGAIEQDADVIAFIYRDEVYNKSVDNPDRGIAEIEIAKHRNGPTGTIKLKFDPKTQTFTDNAV